MKHISTIDNQIEVGDLLQWIADEQWHTFAFVVSSKMNINKKIQSAVGKQKFRVLNDIEIVYEGFNASQAVSCYNNITQTPEDQPKILG